jgi:hypothetical protein
VPTVLLKHRGRKSGKMFVTPLLYLPDGADVVIVASCTPRPRPGRADLVVAEAGRSMRISTTISAGPRWS